MTYGSLTYGAGTYGGSSSSLALLDPPDDPPDIDWDPDADLPVGAPTEETVVPEVAFELIERDGTHVAWVADGHGLRWRRDNHAGEAGITVQRTSALLADLVAPRMLRVRYRGIVVQDALIRPCDDNTHQTGEEAAQTRAITAPGHLAVFDEGLAGPWSETSRPTSDSQRFNFAHPDYQMTAAWEPATEMVRQDEPSERWTASPSKWTAHTAYWIAGSADTDEDAEPGDFYGRRKFTTEDTTYAVEWNADNDSELHIDGVRQGETTDWKGPAQRVDIRFTAGEHTFAVHWANRVAPGVNPTGFIFALSPIDDYGRLGDPVLVSDSSWMILDRPANPPGWKIGRIVEYLDERWAARGGPAIAQGFTADEDFETVEWPEVPDLSTPATSTLFQFLMQLAETYVDLSMRPGSFTLDLWNKGGRGSVLATEFGSGYDAVDLPCITSLDHTIEPPYATSILGHWADGWVRRSVLVDGYYIERPLELPNVLTLAEAEKALDELLDIFGRERIQYRFSLFPRSDAQRPHVGFDVGDWIMVPDPEGVMASVQVQSITGTVDANGQVMFQIEAGDLLLSREERVMSWLQQMSDGAFGGRSTQATSTKTEPNRQLVQPEARPLRFHRKASDNTPESDPETAEETGRIVQWAITLGTAQGSDVDVILRVDGVSTVTTTVPAGDSWATTRCNIPVDQGVELLSARCTDTGFAIVAKAVME